MNNNFFTDLLKTQQQAITDMLTPKNQATTSNPIQDVFGKTEKLYQDFFGQKKPAPVEKTPIEQAGEMMQSFLQQQTVMAQQWTELLQKAFTPAPTNMKEQFEKLYMQMMTQMTQTASSNMIGNLMQGLTKNNGVYGQMEQLFPMMQQNITANNFKPDMTSMMDGFKSLDINKTISQLMGNISPNSAGGTVEQLSQMGNTLFGEIKKMTSSPFMEQMMLEMKSKMTKEADKSKETGYDALLKMQKVFKPLMVGLPASNEKEMFEAVIALQDEYSQYYIHSSKIQEMTNQILEKSMQVTTQKVADRMAKGETITFDDFFQSWLNVTEADLIALYQGKEFSVEQGKMVQVSTSISKLMETQMEKTLKHLPLASRTDLDELSATIHELRVKVRGLEQNLAKKTAEKPTEKPTEKGEKETPKKAETAAKVVTKAVVKPVEKVAEKVAEKATEDKKVIRKK